MTRTGVHSGLEKHRFDQAEDPRSSDLRKGDQTFVFVCKLIHKREVLVEVHQTCWLQRLLFPVKVTTLYNVCAVPWGCSVPWGVFSTVGGYHEYRGGIS